VFIDIEHKHDYTESDIIRQNLDLLPGGVGRPRDCTARHRVAVIVPYRDRRHHLNILLSHLHPMLQRQQLDYRIYVVEQVVTDAAQGRSQEFATGDKRWSLGTEVPQRGPGAAPRWGSGGKAGDKCYNFQLRRGTYTDAANVYAVYVITAGFRHILPALDF